MKALDSSMLYADLVIYNAKIITLDAKETRAEAVASKYGKIIVVGTNSEIRSFIGPDTKVIDLKGKTVLPGLIDSHCHMASVGARRKINVELSEESGIRQISDIQDRLRQKAKTIKKGAWIFGINEDDFKLKEKRHPTKWELDEASMEHPIAISTIGGHFYVVNSKAFEIAKITKYSPDPIGGKIDRNEEGELTGGIHELAVDLIIPPEAMTPSSEAAYEGIKEILVDCSRVGLTMVYDMVNKTEIKALIEMKNRGELPIRMRMDADIELKSDLEKVGIIQGIGDDELRLCGLKFFFDGAISARTAAVTEPYLDKPGFYGVMATTKEIAKEKLESAYSSGYRLSCHANGDAAIDIFLKIMEELQSKYPRTDPRNRDIHCSVIRPDIVEKISKLGILPTIFGPYPFYHGDKLIPAFGEARLERMFAARSFLDSHVKLSAHSDHPASPINPLIGIHALVNRKTKSGQPLGRSQRITVIEALKLYTINAAYHSYDEKMLGSIEEGKLMDLVVLNRDITTIPIEEIKDLIVEMTIIDGKLIYRR